jgi:hypothetical protein
VNLSEVKVSALAGAREQLRRMDEVIELLNTGSYPAAPADLPTRILQIEAPYTTHLDALRRLLAEARLARFAWSQPHPAISIGAIHYAVPDVDGRAERTFAEMRRLGGWDDASRGFTWTGAQRRMRDRTFTPTQFAPLSIYPIPPADVADLILGFMDTVVHIDIPKLEQALDARGLAASVERGAEPFLRTTVGRYTVTVPGTFRETMLNELATIDSLVAVIETLLAFAARSSAADRVLTVFGDESGVWNPKEVPDVES